MDAMEAAPEPAPAKRKGRKPKTEVVPAPTAAQAPLTAETQPAAAVSGVEGGLKGLFQVCQWAVTLLQLL
jgi:hypothetical protein